MYTNDARGIVPVSIGAKLVGRISAVIRFVYLRLLSVALSASVIPLTRVSFWKIKIRNVKHRYFRFFLQSTHDFNFWKRFGEPEFPHFMNLR